MEILDASHKKADPPAITSNCACLSKEERAALLELLLHHEDPSDGAVGIWNGPKTELKSEKGAAPCFSRPFPVPRVHVRKIKIHRPVKLGVLKWTKANEWAAPAVVTPKKTGESVLRLIFAN
jgi:hypothetical protein